ncbi:hypothetical protein [Subtercola sp. RTI3]|uniref:hypothetical protein n=1 Tax=Subtercola sp. RTI3 TaxID=3048639 RepID=UPI002B2244B4|nr:hypothetical protein [Subtercola sp. RTI3]MEA9983664.1 hypothetical protein [Subtercola sp. RTI3]
MADTSWIAWSGWAFIGNTTQVLSLVAIAFAVIEVLARRRAIEPVAWTFDIVGTAQRERGKFHLATFGNVGSGVAQILNVSFIESRVWEEEDFRFRSVMGSGQTVDLFVSAERIERAWMIILWRSHSDSNVTICTWLPLASKGERRLEWETSVQAAPTRYWWMNWRRGLNPGPVGPGHLPSTAIRRSNDQAKSTARTIRALSGVPEGKSMSPWSLSKGVPNIDIPQPE